MSFEDQPDFAKQVADLNIYGQNLNRCGTVEEVVSMTIEAMSLLFQVDYSTFVEVQQGELRIVQSTNPYCQPGEDPGDLARRAYRSGEKVTVEGEAAQTEADPEVTGGLAVPAAMGEDVVAILVMRTTSGTFSEAESRPLELLASHCATAISNIRSRERLERARRDLATRKEMVEMYDSLLRHDLGNDLQVVEAFSEALVDDLEGTEQEHAERVHRAARSSIDLIDRIGEVVKTLEEENNPEPQDLQAILESVVGDVDAQYEDLTVEFDPSAFDYEVYGGDLLDSVFTNIVSNAALHNEGPVTVTLSAEVPEPDTLVVNIADDGSGVPEAIRDEIFEMGEKGPESDGTGLGLGFVKTLVESYGGTVDVGDSDAGGAEFRVRLELVK